MVIVYRKRASGKDHTFYRFISKREFIERYYFAIGTQFAHTATDELSGLGTEIEDNYFFVHIILIVSPLSGALFFYFCDTKIRKVWKI